MFAKAFHVDAVEAAEVARIVQPNAHFANIIQGATSQRQRLLQADKDLGVLREGGFADLVVLDPSLIKDKATYENPQQMCEGIERVMVNGQWSFADKQVQDQAAGKFLRRLNKSQA